MNTQKTQRAYAILQTGGKLSLVLFPLILMIAFAMHYDSLAEFFVVKLSYEPRATSEFMANLLNPAYRQRYYTLPHLIGYLDLPLLIGAALYLGSILFKDRPWVAIIGIALSLIGAVYMGGVFGSWLSFAAIGTLPPDQANAALPALAALTEMRGPMLLTTMLSGLGLAGLLVLGGGLFFTSRVPKWSSFLIFAGNLLIFVFTDLDNWMFLGALLMLIGALPISLSGLTGRKRDHIPAAQPAVQ